MDKIRKSVGAILLIPAELRDSGRARTQRESGAEKDKTETQ